MSRVLHFSGAGKSQHVGFRDVTRGGSQLAALATHGQFEQAIDLGRQLSASGAWHDGVADRMSWLESTMAPPPSGSTSVTDRSWASAVPGDLLLEIQQGIHHQRYAGRQFVKSPFDLAMYLQLLERERPPTIVEIGSKEGGSAMWLADVATSLGVDCTVYSYDLTPVTDVEHPGVEFRSGDGRRLDAVIDSQELASWPHPWIVIDDADHLEPTTTAVLEFFDPHLLPGDVVVVEDGNLSDMYPHLFAGGRSGPHQAVERFLSSRSDRYEIAADLCDLFGHNTTTASNGILRRCRPAAESATVHRLALRPWSDVAIPQMVLDVPSMLSIRERQVLFWLAQHHVAGYGRVIDGGSFLGGSTAALAAGLAARGDGEWDSTIASYDLFKVEEYTLAQFGDALPDATIGSSFRPAFDANIAPWARHVEVCEGDAASIGWTGEPIEVLFLDMVKTWELNDFVLAEMLPRLIPGHSVIIQQDYLWGSGPWIHLTMELLDGCVQQLDAMENGSVVYLLTDEVPKDVIGMRLRSGVTADQKRSLMNRAVSRWQGRRRAMVELARVLLTWELDGRESAMDLLDEVVAATPVDASFEQAAQGVRRQIERTDEPGHD